MHSANTDILRCDSKEIRAELLEAKVFEVIETVMLDSVKLRESIPFFTDDHRAAGPRRARKLERISAQLLDVDDRKKRIIEVYASGDLSRDAYIARNRAYDAEAIELRRQKAELMQSTPLLDQRNAVDAGIAYFCDGAGARLARCRVISQKGRDGYGVIDLDWSLGSRSGSSCTHLKLSTFVGSPTVYRATCGKGHKGRWNWTPLAGVLFT
jgi:hypothetical protein